MNINAWLSIVIIVLILLLIAALVFNGRILNFNFRLLNKNIRDSVQPKFIDISPNTQSLIDMAIEVWRLEKRLSKAAESLSADQNKAFENSTAKLKRFLEKNDISFNDYTDQKYNEGLNLDVLSMEKDSSISESIIKETHEPAVFHKGQLIKKAKVVVLEK